ncbi:phosphatidylcholine:diacylglycerol cholinephosphotransferase 1 [Artemisia annua]|uniref:Phosphatidylcholine:diacylglycerol cholinephosphotransferase 1 n=1 Tax=Artemisia annua TaxID=35608 RepID=A0A2U1NCD0_ARTAN|nr:phosphatidylcholine:diacylglycerol cholinephosphotransferase 1 [Artemisia annua]
MDGDTLHHRSPTHATTTTTFDLDNTTFSSTSLNKTKKNVSLWLQHSGIGGFWSWTGDPLFMKWTMDDVRVVLRHHPVLCLLVILVLFFMGVEYTLKMVPSTSPPFDIGFVATVGLHRVLAASPALNTVLAGLNTGYLGSGVDFPVGNVSFFLFYSGHVAASVIASLDMRRMQRLKLAYLFDIFNLLQVARLLSTRGHYTIDLVVGVGAAILFDSIAETYIQQTNKTLLPQEGTNINCHCHCKTFSKVGNGTQSVSLI